MVLFQILEHLHHSSLKKHTDHILLALKGICIFYAIVTKNLPPYNGFNKLQNPLQNSLNIKYNNR